MTCKQHQHIADHYRRLAMHEMARGHRRLAVHYLERAQEHEAQALVILAA